MHEELKREFEEKFCTKAGIFRHNVSPIGILEFIESKLPKEVEIEKPWDKISIKCPACRKVSLYTEDNFCPNCGSKLIWK